MMNTLCRVSQRNLHQFRRFHKCVVNLTAAEAQVKDATSTTEKPVPPHISKIADDIVGLNLIEVATLSDLLKKRLNLPDTPMMSFASAAPVAAKAEEEEEEVKVQTVQTAFTVKMLKFDASKKIEVIKAVKNILPNCNLVQAKKFVENLPGTMKTDVPKQEAEDVKKVLEPLGCEITIE